MPDIYGNIRNHRYLIVSNCVNKPPYINIVNLFFYLTFNKLFIVQITIIDMESKIIIEGVDGKKFEIDPLDKTAVKLAMLIEGNCTIGVKAAITKYGYTEARYYQLLKAYNTSGSVSLINKKRGSLKRPVRDKETTNQIIRERYLDPQASCEVISQKMKQNGYPVSIRSVERTITEYGLQKKLINLARKRRKKHRDKQ